MAEKMTEEELEGLKRLKTTVLEQLKDPKTIQELCRDLKQPDDFEISCAVLELEIEGKVAFTGWRTAYQPDGTPIYLGLYVAI